MKSPSGSNFPYYYKDGALHGVHLADFRKDSAKLLGILAEEKKFLENQSITSVTWLDMYGIRLTKEILEGLRSFIMNLSPKITKCGLVGVAFFDRFRINRLLWKKNLG